MQVMIKTYSVNNELLEKGPVILNKRNIGFIEKITPMMKDDVRVVEMEAKTPKNVLFEQKQAHDCYCENNCWILMSSSGPMVIDNETALKLEKWLDE